MRWIPTVADTPDAPRLDIYAALLRDRIVFLADPLDGPAATDAAAQLLYLDADGTDRDISLYLHSGSPVSWSHGGSVSALRNGSASGVPGSWPAAVYTAMTVVHDAMASLGSDVATACVGQATTVSAVLLAAGTPGKRLIAPSARVVLREPSVPRVEGRADELAIEAAEARRGRDALVDLLARYTGRAAAAVSADLRRTTVLSAPDAIGYGLADHLVARRTARA